MRSRFLFPFWFRYLGLMLLLIHVPIVMFKKEMGFSTHGEPVSGDLFNSYHLFFMATTLLMAIGLFFIAFAKERIEDEQIFQLRQNSLQWAIYVNYILLVVSLILSKDTEHILFLNLLVPLVFFIVRFKWKIFQNNRLINKEEGRA